VATQRTRPPRDGRPGRERDLERDSEAPAEREDRDGQGVEQGAEVEAETTASGGDEAES
jgi:hypothetical protein